MFYKYKNKSMNQRILIAGDASAEAVTTLVFMALHDRIPVRQNTPGTDRPDMGRTATVIDI